MTPVVLTTGIAEQDQEGSFMNATLQPAGPDLALSIATHFSVPASVAALGEQAVANLVYEALTQAAKATLGLSFEVQLGPSRNFSEK